MRQIREILRLKYEQGLPHRAIAGACGVGVGTVSEYVRRAQQAGVSWPLPAELDDRTLEARLFAPVQGYRDAGRGVPDLAGMHEELKRPGVTLQLLWQEYRGVHPQGYSYSQFCELYRRFARKLKPTMRQAHQAGEKTFVDFSGKRPHLVDRRTGELIPVELFVGVLGASGYTYAVATRSQGLADWVSAHTRMLEYFGGTSEIWVPDQLKSAVSWACRYEPGVNRTYQDLATHYGAVVVPARPGKARDKAKVESAVLVVQRWILARLRQRTFFELDELNAAIHELLEQLNDRPLRKLGVSRHDLWQRLDLPALKPLPVQGYQLAQWKLCRVNIDYHVEVERHLYSVPYQLVHEQVEARYTATIVEVYFKSRRVASHVRCYNHQTSTCAEHMPSSHRAHAEWTPSRLIRWAERSGAATGRLVAGILARRPHPEQGYRSCLGLLRLGRNYGSERLEAACARAEQLRSYSYTTVKNILGASQDRLPFDPQPHDDSTTHTHTNIRGSSYYAAEGNNAC